MGLVGCYGEGGGCWDGVEGGGGDGGGDGGAWLVEVVVVVVVVREGEEGGFCGVDGLTPELDVEVGEVARELIHACIAEDNLPGADAGFTPEMC